MLPVDRNINEHHGKENGADKGVGDFSFDLCA